MSPPKRAISAESVDRGAPVGDKLSDVSDGPYFFSTQKSSRRGGFSGGKVDSDPFAIEPSEILVP